ncbi:Na+/H+ antiporter NhaC family protein [Hyperthermus butylicus]|uniref:Na+/H+ antiporter n=1 Tax=Hyperthermus butylicus (strain DSM 5456 / JCM 9403 / PLM1-5) TaxID=415426 RepID=A2BMF6_HYPBU|nr:Na+/H+ antiporter NhaC family protein [Hyperthermus butylicus]ABM81167.1 putative Na+/H+ antiporter [Hyperthermus butylicus DSM 5456]
MADFGPLSLLPPLLAIILAIVTRQVLLALFAGIWVGAFMLALAGAAGPAGYAVSVFRATSQSLAWIIENATDSWNATILVFNFVIGAFVGILYVSGALHSVAAALTRKVRSARQASLLAYILGWTIFFDDYTNTVVVGNTVRPLTDSLRVSRELLSYIVDSTAAPVAGLLIISTWIGYEVGLIRDSFTTLAEEAGKGVLPYAPDPANAMYAWIMSVPYRFYSILALTLVLIVILTRRHYGPMLEAEHRAVKTGKVLRDGAQPLMPTETVLGEPSQKQAPPWIFPLSILALVAATLVGMWLTGADDPSKWWETDFATALMNADAATALLWGSFAGYIAAAALILATGTLSLSRLMEYTVRGMYLMVLANTILLLAWSLKSAADAVGTADYIVSTVAAAGVHPFLIPPLIFAASAFISFTTGTSWGTFAIMMPIAIPLAWKLAIQHGLDPATTELVTYAAIASVFAGGVFGDHCSPISDTTIMSSMFTGADHIDHVNTQIPYALTTAAVSLVLYTLFAAGITHPAILLPIGVILLAALHRLLNISYAKRRGLPPVVPNYVLQEV